MPGNALTLDGILGPTGALATQLPGFEFRRVQLEMAHLIGTALREERPAVVEAGTGTGKTFGYLVPVIMSGLKTVISTGTKNLQEQIFLRDLPLLTAHTGLKTDAIMMKGRKNYLCLHRYHQRFSQSSFAGYGTEGVRERLERWVRVTDFGDREELPWMADQDVLWDTLSASSEECRGAECPFLEECFLAKLRSKAAESALIIVNHHLFFADMKVRESGFGEIIPRYQAVVFDEAHHLEEVATAAFGERLSTAQLTQLARDIDQAIQGNGGGDSGSPAMLLGKLRRTVVELEGVFEPMEERERLGPEILANIKAGPGQAIRRCLQEIQQEPVLREWESGAGEALLMRARELERLMAEVLAPRDAAWLHWYEKRKRGLVLYASPLDVSDSLKERLFDRHARVILTSATLATNGRFDYIAGRVGLPDSTLSGIFPSHFDFRRQTLLYVPTDLPPPVDTAFVEAAAERVARILKLSRGRALVLFTSYHNLNRVYPLLADRIPYRLLRQGDAPRSVLLDAFRRDISSILLATGSFWQGIDVPGEALSCLIIDKLPFSSPGDPLVAARIENLRERGQNPFMTYQLPAAILTLKQGLGRLIRRVSDRGVMAVLDIRLRNSRYGRYFLESIPPVPLSEDIGQVARFFNGAGPARE